MHTTHTGGDTEKEATHTHTTHQGATHDLTLPYKQDFTTGQLLLWDLINQLKS